MFNDETIIAGLEVGTAKVCAVVGQVSSDGALDFIGHGQASSTGVCKGEIVNPDAAIVDIRKALRAAEEQADVELRSVYLGVTGGHLHSFNNRGVHTIASVDREIAGADVQEAVRHAQAINLPAGHDVIHAIRQDFHVDRQGGIPDPEGMLGERLEVDVHVVHGSRNRLGNAVRVLKGMELDVESLVFNGRASALAVVPPEAREQGALAIDFGAGATEYVAWANSIIGHSGVLAVGGDHVTNDLSIGLKITQTRAEHLKREHGRAVADSSLEGDTITLHSVPGQEGRSISLANLQRIMAARLEETLLLIREDLSRAGMLLQLGGGVFLTGGGARVSGLAALAAGVFETSARVAHDCDDSGPEELFQQPEFSTAIGLVRYGAQETDENRRQRGWLRRALGV